MPVKNNSKNNKNTSKAKVARSVRNDSKSAKTSGRTKPEIASSRNTRLEKTTPASNHNPVSRRSLKVKRSYALALLAVIALIVLLYLLRNLFVAAVVNGQPVSRFSVITELERQGGKQTLESIVTKTLITQEANKRNITVSQKDVDDEMKNIQSNLEKQGQKLDQVLALQGMTRQQLEEQIRLQKMIEKMVGSVNVSEKEIDDYITSNQDSLPTDQDQKTMRNNIKQNLRRQKLNTKAQAFLENLRKNAKIDYYVKY